MTGKKPAGLWYADGVRFRCQGPECGACCSGRHGPGAVWVDRTERQRLAQLLALSLDGFRRRYVRNIEGRPSLRERGNHDCIFYRPGEGCGVYAARPTQCRTYPFWGRVLASPRTWELEAEACPGIDDTAPLVPRREILVQLGKARRDGPPQLDSPTEALRKRR